MFAIKLCFVTIIHMEKHEKIYVAGHKGLVGSAIVRELEKQGYNNLILKTSQELNLTDEPSVKEFFESEKPDYVVLAAAKVGGINANSLYPAEFIYQNLKIQNNVIHYSYLNNVKKLLFLGSSCIYPRMCPQPIKESYLLTGELETTNYAYALAKITGLKMCQAYNEQYGTDYISCMPTNLYGINDNFDLKNSHVLPALLRKFHEGKLKNADYVEVWGSGKPLREFLYVDDLAQGCIFLLNNYSGNETVNIGTGEDLTIKELAQIIKEVVGFKGEIKFDPSKPDGTPKKLLDVSKINSLGWKAQTPLREGIKKVYDWFLSQQTLRCK